MGKASRRKKERRNITPAAHCVIFDSEPGSRMSAPISGKGVTGTSICKGVYGQIAHGSGVSKVEEHSGHLTASMEAVIHRSTKVNQFTDLSKKAQEQAIGEIFAIGRSVISGIKWRSNSGLPEASDVDIELIAVGHEPVKAQLTRAQPSDSWELKLSDQYETWHTMEQVSSEILNAIQTKIDHLPDRKDLVLVLDSYILPLPEPALRRVYADHFEFFKQSDFKEIWYVSLQPSRVTSLYPEFKSVDAAPNSGSSQTIGNSTASGGVRFRRPGSEQWEYIDEKDSNHFLPFHFHVTSSSAVKQIPSESNNET